VATLIPLQAVVYIAFPPPTTVEDYFALFQHNPLLALVDLDLLLTIDYIVMVPFYLALYASLSRASRSWAALGLISGLFSVILFIFSREATFSMLRLSNDYVATDDPGARASIVGSGRTLLTMYDGGSFGTSYLLGAASTLVFSALLLRFRTFGRAVGVVGIVTGVTMLVPPNVGPAGVVVAMLSLIPTMVWLILLSRAFLRLHRASVIGAR
jgi:hypothetical protein